MTDTILITGARSAAALDLAREFDALGYAVHLADCSSSFIARWSLVPVRVHRYASPRHDSRGFRRDIADLVEAIDPVLVVPSCEEVFHLAAPSLVPVLAGRLFAPDIETLRRLHAKDRFAVLCRDLGLNVPETHRLAEGRRFVADPAGWVFKPCYSRFGTSTLIGPNAARVAALDPSPAEPWIVQRRVVGDEASFYATARHGKLAAFVAYHGAWRLRGGASYSFGTLTGAVAETLEGQAAALAGAVDLTGQIACDAITDGAGQTWLIECNPRATSGLHLLSGTGRLARAILTGSGEVHRAGLATRHLTLALVAFGLPEAARAGRWRAWRRQWREGSDVVGQAGDRWPGFGALADTALFSLAARRLGVALPAATTSDIEWNGEALP